MLIEPDTSENGEGSTRKAFVYLVLVAAVCAVSSAGAVMKSMAHAAAITRAGWRLQVTSIILFPGFIHQWRICSEETQSKWLESKSVKLLFGSGMALALHFALWVYSIDHTSLPHSLIFVCTPPLMFAILNWFKGVKMSYGEVSGLIMGLFGTMIVAESSSLGEQSSSTFLGDFSALLAAVAFVGYLSIGQNLREWMPLYLYAFPITIMGSIWLALMGIGIDGLNKTSDGLICGPFSWISKEFLLPNLYLGLGPGFVGHTGLNFVVKYISPLAITMAISLEPVLGSLFGWIIGVSDPPGLWTCIGGIFVVISTVVVSYFTSDS